MTPDPWRYRCPEGHCSTENRPGRGGYYCKMCDEMYYGDPVDWKHHDTAEIES